MMNEEDDVMLSTSSWRSVVRRGICVAGECAANGYGASSNRSGGRCAAELLLSAERVKVVSF
ncbi:hypothetical protein L195_g054168 [Trifolium pratense]|uniref:Uncharacterized protein n=1 Tax=Trifolium pratense TaxID=57577 RepID=A0A2K3KEM6_TRIPR|nr:hypothetical protein L195_g054168 [Trifolium pratense]